MRDACHALQAKEEALSASPSVAMVQSAMDLYRQAAEQFSAVDGSEGKHEEVLSLMHAFLQSDRVLDILNQPEPWSPASSGGAAEAGANSSSSDSAPAAAEAAPPPPPMTTHNTCDEAAVGFTTNDDDNKVVEPPSQVAEAQPVGSMQFMIDDELELAPTSVEDKVSDRSISSILSLRLRALKDHSMQGRARIQTLCGIILSVATNGCFFVTHF
jgi:hypothetical protein